MIDYRQDRGVDRAHAGFGSFADICSAKGHARFAPNSDRESGFPQTVMSAFGGKADTSLILREKAEMHW